MYDDFVNLKYECWQSVPVYLWWIPFQASICAS